MRALMVVDSGPGSTVLSSRISSKMLPSLLLLAASTRGVFFAGSEAFYVILLNTSSIFLTSAINASACLEVSAFVKYVE